MDATIVHRNDPPSSTVSAHATPFEAFPKAARTLVAAALVCSLFPAGPAYGAEDPEWQRSGSTPGSADVPPDTLQQEIERTATEYEKALEHVDELNFQIEKSGKQIAGAQTRMNLLSSIIPRQQEKSDRALRGLYKLQKDSGEILEFVLNTDNINDFAANLDYIQRVGGMQLGEINRLFKMKEQREDLETELEEAHASLVSDRDEAETAAKTAEAALENAQEAREEAQRKAAEMVLRFSGIGPGPDGADWGVEEGVFAEVWGKRIDAYLEGTPMAGLGTSFARAAWRYGVDPRWSPAISYIESSNGRYCIKPHNAWGWGAADSDPEGLALSWNSWDEAIDAHVRGLARGYGYTITVQGARTYCPPNWERWYKVTCDQMSKI